MVKYIKACVLPTTRVLMLHEAYYEISFKIYMINISNCPNYVKMTIFPDDCVMYLSGNNWNTVHRKIQSNFEAVVDWTFRNNLKPNLGIR